MPTAARRQALTRSWIQVYRHLLHNTLMRDRDQFDVRLWPPFYEAKT